MLQAGKFDAAPAGDTQHRSAHSMVGFKEGENPFAELPRGGVYHFYSGHRLWIAPGETATHLETWNLHKNITPPENENEVQAFVEKLGSE